jgi:hypothetical protein
VGQDSSTDSTISGGNPVEQVLDGARRLGEEYCWPRDRAAAVIEALADLDQLVVGFEEWVFETESGPTVLSISEYEAVIEEDWDDAVRRAARAALTELSRSPMRDTLVQVSWFDHEEAGRLSASGRGPVRPRPTPTTPPTG